MRDQRPTLASVQAWSLVFCPWSLVGDWLKPDDTLFRLLGAPACAAFTLNFPPDKTVGLGRTLKDAYALAFFESGYGGCFEVRLLAATQHRPIDIDNLRHSADPEHNWRSGGHRCRRRKDRRASRQVCCRRERGGWCGGVGDGRLRSHAPQEEPHETGQHDHGRRQQPAPPPAIHILVASQATAAAGAIVPSTVLVVVLVIEWVRFALRG